MNTCVWKPMAKTAEGELKESRLFQDLLSFTNNNREQAVPLYGYLKSEQFKEEFSKKVKFDELQEPILDTVLNKVPLKGLLDKQIVLSNILNSLLSKEKLSGKNSLEDSVDNYKELSRICNEFNTTSPYKERFVALIKNDKESSSISLTIEPLTDSSSVLAKSIQTNYILNNKIRTILNNYGISIGSLTSLQERLRVNGVVDYENAKVTSEGLIELIRLAKGERGEQALPEEFSHFIIDITDSEPLIKRLISLCQSEEIQKYTLGDKYEEYSETYQNDQNKLSREVAGKLVSKMLLNKENSLPQYQSFFNKVLSSIKSFISKLFNSSDINNAIRDAELAAQTVATRALSDDRIKRAQLNKLKGLTNLYQLSSESNKAANAIQISLNALAKEFDFYSKKLEYRINAEKDPVKKQELIKKLADYQTKVKTQVGDLQKIQSFKQFEYGIERIIEYGAAELAKIVSHNEKDNTTILNKIIESDDMSLQEKAALLVDCKNIILSNKQSVDYIDQILLKEKNNLNVSEATITRLKELESSLKLAEESLYTQSLLIFKDFIEDGIPDEGITITSSKTPKKITRNDLYELLRTADKDISILDTWVQAAADASDIVIKLADKKLKEAKSKSRQRVIQIKHDLLAVASKLKNNGIKNTDFMFEKYSDGSLGNRYISEINWTKFEEDKEVAIKTLDKVRLSAWFNDRFDYKLGQPSSKYYSVDLDSILPKGSYEREYYDYFMNLRKELISILPIGTYKSDPNKAIQITKDLWEKISSSSPTTWTKQALEEFKYSLISKSDDTQFGAKSTFEGKELLSIPIFFINNVEDEKMLSRDTVSTMLAFADMAVNYDEMNQVANYFELGKDVMNRRRANVIKKGEPVYETIGDVSIPLTTDAVNTAKRYNELIRSQLYSRYYKEETKEVGNKEIKLNKAASLLNRLNSMYHLAFNGLAGGAALINDMININSEALAGQYFNAKQLFAADKIYRKHLANIAAEAGNPIKNDKLSLFLEYFNVLHEYETDIRDIEWDKNKLKRLISEDSLYFFMHAGAHFGESRTAIAQALAAKIKSNDGTQESNLWNVMEVVPIDPEDLSKGSTLKIKDGYSLSKEEVSKFEQKCIGLNGRLFGYYNKANRNTLQSTAVGQLVWLYKNFMVPAINRRFGSANINLDTNEETKGFYVSAGQFLMNLITNSKGLGFNIKAYWNDMTEVDRANCIRAVNELSVFAALVVLTSILASADWDKEDNPWHRRFITYMANRSKTEIGAFTPIGVFGELWNVVKSPSASVGTLEGIANLTKLLNYTNYETFAGEDALVQKGKYKGYSKAYKAFMSSPLAGPTKTIMNMLHPEDSLIAFN